MYEEHRGRFPVFENMINAKNDFLIQKIILGIIAKNHISERISLRMTAPPVHSTVSVERLEADSIPTGSAAK